MSRLAGAVVGMEGESKIHVPSAPLSRTEPLDVRFAHTLNRLASNHIFKWTPHYRDALRLFFTDALSEVPGSGQVEIELQKLGNLLSTHSEQIFDRGYKFQIDRGLLPDVAEIKSIGGLQSFLDLIVSVYLEQRATIVTAKSAELLWGLLSVGITSILSGYGAVQFAGAKGWTILSKNGRAWVPPVGLCRGTELLSFFDEFPITVRDEELHIALTASALAVERVAHRFHGDDVLLPRHSRLSIRGPARLDITLSARRGALNRDLLLTCFHRGVLTAQPILSALSLRAVVVIGRIDPHLQEQLEQEKVQSVVDATGIRATSEAIHLLSELIAGKLDSHIVNDTAYSDPTVMTHNFAGDFPLDDPDFRRQFMVERYSVKRLLQEFDGNVGVHLWCSVRRSGKTTAAQEMADFTGSSVVVTQTMDSVLRQPIQNIFRRRLRDAFDSGREISDEFFMDAVNECTLAASPSDAKGRRIVFIIDEYETLFGLIDARVRDDSGLKVKVALPLLSQMVDFATQHLLIFMGQRPDAYLVLSAQSQLSPLVQQHNFPLFNHVAGAHETEFSQFLSYVLSDKLSFDDSFTWEVFLETSGHPYLTVNLMVDFCDWLIENSFRMSDVVLSERHFSNFAKDRLTPAALKRSGHYEFFQAQMAEYLSEQAMKDEPWLYAIGSILRAFAHKHPKNWKCSVNVFEQMATPICTAARIPVSRLLTTGSLSNFLRDKDGWVSPGVKLLARLAGSASPTIN